MWDEFAYPFEDRQTGVIEDALNDTISEMLAANVDAVGRMLKTADRDLLSNCLYATANWAHALTSAGAAVRKVGGVGQHVDTVPPEPRDRLSGYLTDDDGLVQHWWLMVEPHGLIFDPTAHQFDHRGGVDLGRYQVEGQPLVEWRRDWPARAEGFPIVVIGSDEANWRRRLGLRGGR